MKKTVKIEGMRCMHCVASVKKALEGIGLNAEVDLETKTAVVIGVVSDEMIRETIESKGFTVIEIQDA